MNLRCSAQITCQLAMCTGCQCADFRFVGSDSTSDAEACDLDIDCGTARCNDSECATSGISWMCVYFQRAFSDDRHVLVAFREGKGADLASTCNAAAVLFHAAHYCRLVARHCPHAVEGHFTCRSVNFTCPDRVRRVCNIARRGGRSERHQGGRCQGQQAEHRQALHRSLPS